MGKCEDVYTISVQSYLRGKCEDVYTISVQSYLMGKCEGAISWHVI